MTMWRAAIAVAAAIAIAACGDHLVVPADKTGKCVAGLLTKCGDACVDTQTDLANCGSCMLACTGAKICVQGKCTDACPPGSTKCGDSCVNTDLDRGNCGMCGKACAGNEVCAKGKCAASCEAAGYVTCAGMMGPVDAGGALNCVAPSSDANNCGACGVKCMVSEACSNGTCCASGLVGCNGQCVDVRSDPNNCGSCNTKCGMTAANCVLGACSKCNNKVLVLSDNVTSANTDMRSVFTKAGFQATVVDNGVVNYAGTPAASDFGAVGVFPGNSYSAAEMPTGGQQAIISAQASGTGVVYDGFVSYEIGAQNRYVTLKPLSLLNYTGGGSFNSTVGLVGPQFPFFSGIPTSFATTNLWFQVVVNGGTQFASSSIYMTSGGQYRSTPNGRVVHTSMCFNYGQGASQWANDPTTNTWTMNMFRYTAGCTN